MSSISQQHQQQTHHHEMNNNNNNNIDNNNMMIFGMIDTPSSSTILSFIYTSLNFIFTTFPTTLLFILVAASLLYMLAIVYKNLRFIFVHWIRKPHDLRERYGADSWVVISGSSGGIGLGFAVEFAKLGFNIVLMSRSDENLQNAKAEVLEAGKDFNVKVKTIVIDFSEGSTIEFWKEKFLKPLEDLDVSVLVNNVGMNYTDNFENIDEQMLLDFVSVNCTSQIMATRMLMKKLINRTRSRSETINGDVSEQQDGEDFKRSAILSISSVAGQRPLLYLAPYSATKSFNDVFSRSLALEYSSGHQQGAGSGGKSNNKKNSSHHDDVSSSDLSSYLPNLNALSQSSSRIDVLSCRPGYVVSKMSALTEAGGFVLEPNECAAGFLEKLGFVTESYGDFRHAIYCLTYQLIPEFWLRRIRQKRLELKKAKLAEQEKKGNKN